MKWYNIIIHNDNNNNNNNNNNDNDNDNNNNNKNNTSLPSLSCQSRDGNVHAQQCSLVAPNFVPRTQLSYNWLDHIVTLSLVLPGYSSSSFSSFFFSSSSFLWNVRGGGDAGGGGGR